jgi:hypothetical protein
MRTVKWNAFLSGLCVLAAALGFWAAGARADVTTERGASILAFPKVLADGTADTIIQITNISNSMVHARCYYVNAALQDPESRPGPNNKPLWQEIDFTIWLTKQQPTQWQVSTGRFLNPNDDCFDDGQINPEECKEAGIDPGAVPPVPPDFVGELKCIEVDVSDNPIGGNHLKGEATIKYGPDVAKYNAIGIEGTQLAGQTGNELLLNQPSGVEEAVGQYNACPETLIVNHFAEGVTDPVILGEGLGGTCSESEWVVCQSDSDCPDEDTCENASELVVDPATSELTSLTSATVTDLTLIPCQQDFEEQIPGKVKIQLLVYNEFENVFSASTTVECWANFHLYELTSPNDPENSPFHFANLGTTVATTYITPNPDQGGVIGVAGVTRADADSRLTRAAFNIHTQGDRLSASEGEVIDRVILSDH